MNFGSIFLSTVSAFEFSRARSINSENDTNCSQTKASQIFKFLLVCSLKIQISQLKWEKNVPGWETYWDSIPTSVQSQ